MKKLFIAAMLWFLMTASVLAQVETPTPIRTAALAAVLPWVTFAWDANTEPDLAGYKLHYGLTSGTYTTTIDVKNVLTYTVNNLKENTAYFFALTAYDDSDNKSDYSIEVPHTTPNLPPGSPSNFQKTISAESVIINAESVVVVEQPK